MNEGLSLIWQRTVSIAHGFVAALPNLLLALVIFGLFWLLAQGLKKLLNNVLRRAGQSPYVGRALGQVLSGVVLTVGVLVAATVVFPTLNAATLFSTLGFGSVAIGFAFKDIFQNLLAGLLILITRPFHIGDQIISGDTEGTVEDIQVRATIVRTYDNRRVVVPNSDLYTDRVTVNTAYERRQASVSLTLPYGTDLDRAREVMTQAAGNVQGMVQDPAPSALVTGLTPNGVTVGLSYWADPSKKSEVATMTNAVLTAVCAALKQAGVNLSLSQDVTLDPGAKPLRLQLEDGQPENGQAEAARPGKPPSERTAPAPETRPQEVPRQP